MKALHPTRRILIAIALLASACGGGSPSTPTPTPATQSQLPVWNLTGVVRSAAGGVILGVIVGATVTVVDGPDTGKEAISDLSGRYAFSGLHQAGFTIRATANGFLAASQAITLTANSTADFQLPRTPTAALTFEGSLIYQFRGDGLWDVSGTAVNSGDACATAISGTTTITKGTDSLTYSWSLPGQTVRPGERFTYRVGPMSVADGARLDGGTYRSVALFSSIGCS